ncbi:MAG TPA: flippase [Candidatus Methylomirabilis sp.]|nr:flippase [Candidatus Methylomirabilis sp.]
MSGVLWNFLGQGWLLVVAFLATPYIVRTLEVDLYGLYSLAGFVLSYFAFLEFGLGAAVTKYISQYLAEDNVEGVVTSFWAGLAWLAAGGLACVLVVGLLAEGIASSLLHVPARLQPSAVAAFRISALILCASMLAGLTGGTLRSAGRFGMVNLTSIVTGTAQTALSVGLLWAGYSLAEILWGMLVCQAALLAWQFSLCLHALPVLRKPRLTRGALTRLLGYGGILTLASLIGPVLTNVEKLFMARLTSVGLLTYYAVPFSLIDRLGVIPSAFGAVLFPSYSYFSAKEPERNRELHSRGTLYICASYGFFASFFLLLGTPFLRAWMGAEFADRSAPVLGILAVGGLFNAMARPAITALQGVGKPHIPLLLQGVELLLYIPSAYALIRGFGMIGAAAAWSGRVMVDACLLHLASCLELGEGPRIYWKLLKVAGPPLAACSVAFLAIRMWDVPLLTPTGILGILIIASMYGAAVWRVVLDVQTRERVAALWTGA